MSRICSCTQWWTDDPMWDPSCPIEEHARRAFDQQGWTMVEIN